MTKVATIRTHKRYLNRVDSCLSDLLQQQMSVYLWRQMPCSKNMKVYLIRHILLSVSRLIGTYFLGFMEITVFQLTSYV